MAEQIVQNRDRKTALISKADIEHINTELDVICKSLVSLNSKIFKEIGGKPEAGAPVTCIVKFEGVKVDSKNELLGCATRIAHNWAWLNKTLNALFLDPNIESTIEPPPDPPGDGKP